MNVKVKKSVLFNVLKSLLNESPVRAQVSNNGSFSSFFGQMSEPIKPVEHMSTQLSVESPPVEDEEYIPASNDELSAAAARIIQEVPTRQIEFFYRMLHKNLDMALDKEEEGDDNFINEDIRAKTITLLTKLLKKKQLRQKQLFEGAEDRFIQRAKSMIGSGADPQEVIDNLSKQRVFQIKGIGKQQIADMLGVASTPASTEPAPSAELLPSTERPTSRRSRPTRQKGNVVRRKAKDDISGIQLDVDPDTEFLKPLDDLEGPSDELMQDPNSQLSLANTLATLFDEIEGLTEEAKNRGWEFDDQVAPFLEEINLFFQLLFEISYRFIQNQMTLNYGGYTYDPKLDTGLRKKGGFKLIPRGPLSRSDAKIQLSYLERQFGINKTTALRQHNILQMQKEDLKGVIKGAIMGILGLPMMQGLAARLESKRAQAYQQYKNDPSAFEPSIGSKFESIEDTIDLIADVMTIKYRQESDVPDQNILERAIEGVFKMVIKKLEDPYKIKNINNFKTKAKEHGKYYKKALPPLILDNITKTSTAKISVKGSKYTVTDKLTGLSIEYKKAQINKEIKDFVKKIVDGQEVVMPDETDTVISDIEPIEFESDEQETETLKIIKDLESLFGTGSDFEYDAVAPLFGFSGAPGLRQWALKFPDRKIAIIQGERRGKRGAVKFMNEFRGMYDNLATNFIDQDDSPGVLSLMIEEIRASSDPNKDQKIKMYERIKSDMLKLSELYLDYTVKELQPDQEYQELLRSPGGAVLRFSVGSVFDKIIKSLDTKWENKMKSVLSDEYDVDPQEAHHLSQHLTGKKNVPNFETLTKTAKRFVDNGLSAEDFFEILKYSKNWFFTTIDKELRKELTQGTTNRQGEYFKIISKFKQSLYTTKVKKGQKVKVLNKPVYTGLKNIIEKSVEGYLDMVAMEQVVKRAQKAVKTLKDKEGLPTQNLQEIRYINRFIDKYLNV